MQFGQPLLPCQGASFHCYRTRTYKLHYYESPTGIKLVLVTEPTAGDLRVRRSEDDTHALTQTHTHTYEHSLSACVSRLRLHVSSRYPRVKLKPMIDAVRCTHRTRSTRRRSVLVNVHR